MPLPHAAPEAPDALLAPCGGARHQLYSLIGLLVAWALCLSCCLSPWAEMRSELVEVERVSVSLWSVCVVQDSAFTCKPHGSLLNMPRPLIMGRGLLLGALLSGAATFAVLVPGLSLVHTEKVKRHDNHNMLTAG
ncbi:unnamed protein product [Knipowitschia caucasica]|uniref:Claudin n=1 Tax=Knipowitschia caucasica TaxID=637954 RepID=A0AAV2LBP0_KNICA